MRNMF